MSETKPTLTSDFFAEHAKDIERILQRAVNQAIGSAACTSDLNRDGACDVIDLQRVVNAALGQSC